MVFRTAKELKEHYALVLKEQGKGVAVDTPAGEQGATIDLLTDSAMIVCKLDLDQHSALEAKSQLDFYGRFSPQWKKIVAVATISDKSAMKHLASSGIEVVIVPVPVSKSVKAPVEGPRFTYTSHDDYRRFEGGQGSVVALCVIALVFLFGLAGFAASRQKQSDNGSRFLKAKFALATQP